MFVKICGLSTPESVREAVGAGADAVGFVLTASPRVVSPSQTSTLLADVPEGYHHNCLTPAARLCCAMPFAEAIST